LPTLFYKNSFGKSFFMKQYIFLFALLFSTLSIKAQNVGIGTTNVNSAKLTVEGSVGPVVGLFKNGSGVSIGISSSNENIGFNYADGKAISTGNGGRLLLNNSASTGGVGLQYYPSTTAGSNFSGSINVLRHIDNVWAGSGHWIDMLYGEPGRIRMANQLYNETNGALNLLPLGTLFFNVTSMHNGSNASYIFKNAGDGSTLLHSVAEFICHAGSLQTLAIVKLTAELDWITKEYDDVYIVGSPSFDNDDTEIYGSYAKFVRMPTGQRDRVIIGGNAPRLWSTSLFTGTLLIFGNRTLN
jgi:hypothetical protein